MSKRLWAVGWVAILLLASCTRAHRTPGGYEWHSSALSIPSHTHRTESITIRGYYSDEARALRIYKTTHKGFN